MYILMNYNTFYFNVNVNFILKKYNIYTCNNIKHIKLIKYFLFTIIIIFIKNTITMWFNNSLCTIDIVKWQIFQYTT